MKSPFNDYDENGVRVNIHGSRTTRIADENLLYNLRYRWKTELAEFSDAQLINEYWEFSMSDWFGDNDARFLEWMSEVEK
jgi:hypothetical protein